MILKRKIKKTLAVLILTMVTNALMLPVPGRASFEETHDGPVTYSVQKGDCLWSIAAKFAVNPNLLAYANEMKPDDVLEEKKDLLIPSGNTILYKVKNGDTLWSIARELNTSVEKMAADNEIDREDILQPNESLIVTMGGIETSEVFSLSSSELDPELKEDKIPQLGIWPVHGRISSNFGPRDGRTHEGIDIAADLGNPICAVANGVVVFAGKRGGYGNAVIINHGRGFRSLYGHASKLEVSVGDHIREGQEIAKVGSTGRSTGPHLHLETLYNGTPYNPLKYLP